MTRDDLIKYCEEHKLPYYEANRSDFYKKDYDGVYVYAKKAYKLTNKHPRKYKNLCVPYCRISGFDDRLYVRDCGYCYYCNDDEILRLLKRLEEEEPF